LQRAWLFLRGCAVALAAAMQRLAHALSKPRKNRQNNPK
jgi:hypothetical protein